MGKPNLETTDNATVRFSRKRTFRMTEISCFQGPLSATSGLCSDFLGSENRQFETAHICNISR